MYKPQLSIPAYYMRGGTSKGVFFYLEDLPAAAQTPGEYRDQLMLRIIGSPDPYGKQTDGMGGATSSTSKVVIISKSDHPDYDVNYLFGQVSIDQAKVDWSGNCGNLSAAVGPFAIHRQLIATPLDALHKVRVWQQNIAKPINCYVPTYDGHVVENGDFNLDGVAFPSAEIPVEFVAPAGTEGSMFPSGNTVDTLTVEGLGTMDATLITAGIPTVFIKAETLGLTGTELQEDINGNDELLSKFEAIRRCGALKMGLIDSLDDPNLREHTPKVAIVSSPASYTASSGTLVEQSSINLNVRALSMGKLHHAMMGTAAVAIASAAAVEGTLVAQVCNSKGSSLSFGHPSGTLKVGGEAFSTKTGWLMHAVSMSRSARVLMQGAIRVPDPA